MLHLKVPCRHGLHCFLLPYVLDWPSNCTDVTADVVANTWLASTRSISDKVRVERVGFHTGSRLPVVANSA